jgi:hypothetical protein
MRRRLACFHFTTRRGATQLNIDGLVDLFLETHPRGACQVAQHKNSLPLHLACQSSCSSAVPIVQLLQVYPEGANVQDWAFEDDQDEEYDNDTDTEDMPIASRSHLHHVCANQDLLTTPHATELLQLLHQAHPETTLEVDHKGRSLLSHDYRQLGIP